MRGDDVSSAPEDSDTGGDSSDDGKQDKPILRRGQPRLARTSKPAVESSEAESIASSDGDDDIIVISSPPKTKAHRTKRTRATLSPEPGDIEPGDTEPEPEAFEPQKPVVKRRREGTISKSTPAILQATSSLGSMSMDTAGEGSSSSRVQSQGGQSQSHAAEQNRKRTEIGNFFGVEEATPF
ncbi:hypothetical protein FA95DRAFT_1568181 [Auriscalpium vulgare]|uniref:Uncharacterized protein n=1 Tax=Auriscalpium vulgare TaxID=40419 RepID=A0ACB8R0P6_9AGAM|nr:hypothetical protein FA95DRAFT_1568181 [Auriscalpium vulgare]